MSVDYNHLHVPGPTTTALTEPFWAAVAEGRLIGQRCNSCDKSIFYPREICPHCWSGDLTWQDLSGRGTLKSFSQVWKPGHPGWQPVAPYVVGLVQLEEGPTMLSQILPGPRKLDVGMALRCLPTLVAGRWLPFFELANP